jgi:hypothetical protein
VPSEKSVFWFSFSNPCLMSNSREIVLKVLGAENSPHGRLTILKLIAQS